MARVIKAVLALSVVLLFAACKEITEPWSPCFRGQWTVEVLYHEYGDFVSADTVCAGGWQDAG